MLFPGVVRKDKTVKELNLLYYLCEVQTTCAVIYSAILYPAFPNFLDVLPIE